MHVIKEIALCRATRGADGLESDIGVAGREIVDEAASIMAPCASRGHACRSQRRRQDRPRASGRTRTELDDLLPPDQQPAGVVAVAPAVVETVRNGLAQDQADVLREARCHPCVHFDILAAIRGNDAIVVAPDFDQRPGAAKRHACAGAGHGGVTGVIGIPAGNDGLVDLRPATQWKHGRFETRVDKAALHHLRLQRCERQDRQ